MEKHDKIADKLIAELGSTNLFTIVRNKILAANNHLIATGLLPANIDQSRVSVELPKDLAHGDLASNNAIILARESNRNPREIAQANAAVLSADPFFSRVEVAGPGFENVKISQPVLASFLSLAVRDRENYGRSNVGSGKSVNVEFVSANPTGPLHVGHGRGAVYGDALTKLLRFTGFVVTPEYYVNDAGAQVEVLARSAYLRYLEALGENIGVIPEGLYPGDYLKPVGQMLVQEFGRSLKNKPETERLRIVEERAVNMMLAGIRSDLRALNIHHEKFFYESDLVKDHDEVADTIESLRRVGLVAEGRLPPPKGTPTEDWEDREQTLFLSTKFGDDIDRPLKKSDGSYTYFAADMAYHRDKMRRGFDVLIDVWGADHAGYVKRMKAAVEALSRLSNAPQPGFYPKVIQDVKVVQLVKLLRAGEPVKMSKRAGDFIKLRDVVDEVGPDPVRFMMLFRKNDAPLDFDLAKVVELSKDNPVFYVQYAHARGKSVFRNAREAFPELPLDISALMEVANLGLLSDPAEISLLRQIALYPRTVEAAALAHEPHRIAFYLYDLASEFHALWTLGNASPHLRFIIQDDPQTTLARLVLVQGVVTVLASGLALLGVEAPSEMR